MKATHIVFTGGGTAGHLFPGLAVAEKLAADRPGVRITFAGTGKRLERDWLPRPVSTILPCRAGRCRAGRARRSRLSWRTWPAILPPDGSWTMSTWPASWAWAATPACPWAAPRPAAACRWCCWSKTPSWAGPTAGSRASPVCSARASSRPSISAAHAARCAARAIPPASS